MSFSTRLVQPVRNSMIRIARQLPHLLVRTLAVFTCVAALPLASGLSGSDQSTATAPPTTAPSATLPSSQPARERLEIAGEVFELEVAADEVAREKGLMYRERIDDHGGMLFIYPQTQAELSFWMKNCPIDIDILYVDHAGRIVATYRMKAAPPRRDGESKSNYDNRLPLYPSKRPAQFAIELKAGTIERLKIKPGQMIEMDVKRLEAMAE
jgi:uncharacterized membrane protein (UPF0127 family)